MIVPAWATGDEFRRLDALGLTMYGQMTAGSWIYIGSQGIVQGTFETLAEAGRRHFGGELAGRLFVSAGLGGMGGAQPLAATMNGATALLAEVDPGRIDKRLRTRYLDERMADIDAAIDRALEYRDAKRARSIGVEANAVDLLERLIARGIVPDLLTDQTSAHDELTGYVPHGISYAEALRLREADPAAYIRAVEAIDGRARPGDARPPGTRRGDVRLRQQPPRPGEEAPASRTPSTSRASCPPTSGRSSAKATVRSDGRRCRATRKTSG